MSKPHISLPASERLRELFLYEPEEGALYWRKRHNGRVCTTKPAGWKEWNGYHGMRVDRVMYKRHRIVWCYFNGDPGAFEIDHINGIKGDDRIENLRTASRSQNQHNRPARSTNKSGLKGVSRHQNGKWRARIVNQSGKGISLGYFDTAEEAGAAYAEAAFKFQKAFTHESVRNLLP